VDGINLFTGEIVVRVVNPSVVFARRGQHELECVEDLASGVREVTVTRVRVIVLAVEPEEDVAKHGTRLLLV